MRCAICTWPQKNTTVFKQYSGLMGLWCGMGDHYCDLSNNDTVHNLASATYDTDVVHLVVEKLQNSMSQGGSGSTAIGTARRYEGLGQFGASAVARGGRTLPS